MLVVLSLIFYLLAGVFAIAGLVFFVLVVIQMFQRDQSTLGIVCLVLTFCGGPLIAFIFGWMKAKEWDIVKMMTAWTICFAAHILLTIVAMVMAIAGAVTLEPTDMGLDPNSLNIEFNMDDASFDLPEGFPEIEATPVEQP